MVFSATRYSDLPFPRYRFIPGESPHPTSHPLGHSYHPPGSSPPAVRFRQAPEWRESIDYLFGCDLYNHGYWWEAHEAWEGLWQLTDKHGPQGHFLQGLIQTSACHLKLHVGHLDGVSRLRRSSAEHLRSVLQRLTDPSYMGLPVGSWLEQVQAYYETRLQLAALHDPVSYPYIVLHPPVEGRSSVEC